jgi:hypothetical protein
MFVSITNLCNQHKHQHCRQTPATTAQFHCAQTPTLQADTCNNRTVPLQADTCNNRTVPLCTNTNTAGRHLQQPHSSTVHVVSSLLRGVLQWNFGNYSLKIRSSMRLSKYLRTAVKSALKSADTHSVRKRRSGGFGASLNPTTVFKRSPYWRQCLVTCHAVFSRLFVTALTNSRF